MKAGELAAFFASLSPNTDVKIAACANGKISVDSPLRLVVLDGGALIQTELFVSEIERRAEAKGIIGLRIVQ